MAVNEFIILAGIIVVGAIFLLVARIFIFGEVKLTQESMYESEAQEIISLIQRITSEQGQYFYYYREISLSNITVKDKVFTYQKDGFKFSFPVPKEVINSDLKDISSVCIVKRKSTIELLEKCPKCNVDYFCSIDECKEDCEDCGRPNSLCVGDNFCNKYIGENCQNSPKDCSCSNGICCPSSPDSDAKGCSVNTNIQKGKECWCSSQCDSGLECNPTAPTFTAYKKTCCDPGKGWNGTHCVEIKCPTANICPGAPTGGGNGDDAWIDVEGNICCPLENIGDISGPVCSNKHCCPTHKPKWCDKPVSGNPRCMSEDEFKNECKPKKVYNIVFAPIGYSPSEFESFKSFAQQAYEYWITHGPFKDCVNARDIVIPYFIDPSVSRNCQVSFCSNPCTDCNYIAKQCTLDSPYKNIWNKIVGICKGTSCGGDCGGCAGGIPSDTSVTNTAQCGASGYKIVSHEAGHSWGLYHLRSTIGVNGCWDDERGPCNGPNAADCSLSAYEISQCIMPYCPIMDHYCPAGLSYLKNSVFKDYLAECS
jgi:hypothetical protein